MSELSPERIASHVAFAKHVKTRNITWNEADKVADIALEALAVLTTTQKVLDTIRGDNLCWIQSDDDLAQAKALPESEFLESCKRYHAQIIAERGTLVGAKTIAQLEIELATTQKALEEAQALADKRYQEGMVGHRAFAKLFGEVMDGKDFDVKLSIAKGIMGDLRARAERAEADAGSFVEDLHKRRMLHNQDLEEWESALTAAREEADKLRGALECSNKTAKRHGAERDALLDERRTLREKVAKELDDLPNPVVTEYQLGRKNGLQVVLSLIDSCGKDEPTVKDCLTTESS